jgi:hypothetical protein
LTPIVVPSTQIGLIWVWPPQGLTLIPASGLRLIPDGWRPGW